MRKIYLVRHGEPDTGTTEKVCLGQRDVPLKETGKEEIWRLAGYFGRVETGEMLSGIFSSPLRRCMETAGILWDVINHSSRNLFDSADPEIVQVEDFQEVNTGIWDGLTFKEIREHFPEEYEERGKNLGTYRIPGGETLEEAGIRFLDALKKLLAETEGNFLIVTHAGVLRAFLCLITGKDSNQINDWKVPHGSVTKVQWEIDPGREGGFFRIVGNAGFLPVETLTLSRIEEFRREAGVSEEQKRHMDCTAAYAMELADHLPEFGARDKQILCYSALLHDLFRSMGRGHEEAAAVWLMKKGYHELAEPVRMHNDAEVVHPGEILTVAEVLYYADKRCRVDRIVTIQERFDSSSKKIRDEEGRRRHRERMEAAYSIEEKLKKRGS